MSLVLSNTIFWELDLFLSSGVREERFIVYISVVPAISTGEHGDTGRLGVCHR
jgi:hypothetical protein